MADPLLPELHLDGIYIRAQINGRWESRCLSDLSWPSVEAWLLDHCKAGSAEEARDFLIRVVKSLHLDIRTVGEVLVTDRQIYADAPEDRLYHAADKTWWRRDANGNLKQAEPPEGWVSLIDP